MATPNNAPNVEKEDEKPRKDAWDKADVVIKGLIPIAVAFAGWWIQGVVTTQNTGKDYMQMAFGILEKKDLTEDMQKNKGLRKWAVDLLQYYSPVKLDEPTTARLINGETTIPILRDISSIPIARVEMGSLGFVTRVISPNGQLVADLYDAGRVHIYRLSDGDQSVFETINAAVGLVFSPDSNAMIVFNTTDFAIIPLISGTLPNPTHSPPIKVSTPSGIASLIFSDNNTIIVISRDGKQTKYSISNELKR